MTLENIPSQTPFANDAVMHNAEEKQIAGEGGDEHIVLQPGDPSPPIPDLGSETVIR